MTKILLLSDSHSFCDDRILDYAQQADWVLHAGDFGVGVSDKLAAVSRLKGVYGNIDSGEIRNDFPEVLVWECEGVKILMIHIGGYPGKYTSLAKSEIAKHQPQLFISGHSHILKAQYDSKNQLLHLNPGACGKSGWHKVRTMMRFVIDGSEIKDLEIIELGQR